MYSLFKVLFNPHNSPIKDILLSSYVFTYTLTVRQVIISNYIICQGHTTNRKQNQDLNHLPLLQKTCALKHYAIPLFQK